MIESHWPTTQGQGKRIADRSQWLVPGGTGAYVELGFSAFASVARQALRGRCANCHVRRVLYRLTLHSDYGNGVSEARCAPCWGIRP